MTRRAEIIKKTAPGAPVSARKLSNMAQSINYLKGGVAGTDTASTWFGEVARTSTTVSIDITSDDVTLTIDPIEFEQIDTVTLKNGAGEVIVLVFNNPAIPTPPP